MPIVRLFAGITFVLLLTSCSSSIPTPQTPQLPTGLPTALPAAATLHVELETHTAEITPTPAALTETKPTDSGDIKSSPIFNPEPTLPATLSPDAWKLLPVIPNVSERVTEIYLRGIELGNNPQAFSKIGDCGSTPAWFLGDFDRGETYYSLGDYQYLEPVIQEFQGSYARTSLAAKSGFNASSIFTPLWANREYCQPDETPLACEYRVQRPILAFIMLGSNDVWHMDTFEAQMRNIIENSIENGVIPVLSTKADNLEKNHFINETIARLAVEYQIPLINYWQAVQELPAKGLQEDSVHITWGPNRFDDTQVMKAGWPVRNLVTLQSLDAIWRAVTNQETVQQ